MQLQPRLQMLRVAARQYSTAGCVTRRKVAMPLSFSSESTPLSRIMTTSPSGLSSIFRRGYTNRYAGFPPSYRSGRRVMQAIIAMNITVVLTWWYSIAQRDNNLLKMLEQNFTLSLKNWREGRVWTLLTSAFSHVDLFHILFNMMTFNAVGGVLLMAPGIGPGHLLGVCIGGAIAGSAGFLYHQSRRPGMGRMLNSGVVQSERDRSGLGASGMVMAVSTAAACLMPFVPMQFMFIPVPVSLWMVSALYIGVDTFFLHSETSPIGHAAHLGGAVFGLAYYALALRRFGGVSRLLTTRSRW